MNPNIARRRRAKAAELRHQADQECLERISDGINVGHTERQISMLAGSALAVYGLLQRSASGLLLAALGGALIWRGHTGHCHVYQALGHSSADQSAPLQQQGA